ncbi:MAG TPA: hypothetical protein VEX13_01415 [Chloroflexia bacterium]|nr:hypothetical protein [Chloroflexia bacterium]
MKGQLHPLGRLAHQARGNAGLLADLLFTYQETNGLDDEELTAFLECEVDALSKLALCRRPRQAPDFKGDVERIAMYAGANGLQLAYLIRSAEAQAALRQSAGRAGPMLQAARDHEDAGTPGAGPSQPDAPSLDQPGIEGENGHSH